VEKKFLQLLGECPNRRGRALNYNYIVEWSRAA
jgi:hypothetical protein